MKTLLLSGVANADFATLIARECLGCFYVLARFRYFYDPSRAAGERWLNLARHQSFANKMAHCGYSWGAWVAPTIATIEVLAGLGVAFGLLTMLSTFGLLCITLFATYCTARTKVFEQNPVDGVDIVASYLWRVEGLYIAFALIVLALGPGAYSLDHIIGSLVP